MDMALRRLSVFGWGVEAAMRVRVIRPVVDEMPTRTNEEAERAAAQIEVLRYIDRQRSAVERRWYEVSGG